MPRIRIKGPPAEFALATPAPAGVQFVDFEQSGMVVLRDRGGSREEVVVKGSYVKFAPTLRVSERSSLDVKATREQLLAAGAIAVVVAPVVVPDSAPNLREVDKARSRTAKEHLQEWFEGVSGHSADVIDDAFDQALETAAGVGL